MTSSVAVFPPGFRVTDANDNPVSGATIEFYAAATTTPKTVYSDSDLLVAIGTSVTTDAGGYPTSGGNKTLVYVDTSYKVIIKDADGSVIATHDRVPGAIGSGSSSSSTAATTFGMGVGDVKISAAATPDAGFIRLTETAQSLLKASYPDLNAWAAAQGYPWGSTTTNFSVPPAAGYFLRFAASDSSVDTGGTRAAGSTQTDQNKSHTHTFSGTTGAAGAHAHTYNAASALLVGGGANGGATPNAQTTSSVSDHTHSFSGTTATSGSDEVRVKNVAFHADMLAVPALVSAALVGAAGLAYKFNSTTSPGSVTTGTLALNNGTLTAATALYVHETDNNGSSLAGVLQGIPSGSLFYMVKVGDPASWIAATLSSTATDAGTYDSFTLSAVQAGGTISNGDLLTVTVMRAGQPGSNGANGTDPGIRWLFSSSTSMGDPSAGNVRFNNATLASITAAAISYSSGETGNPSVTAFVQSWDDSTTTAHRGYLLVKKASAPQNFVLFDITGALADNTTWAQLALTYMAGSGSFAASDALSVQFYRTGNTGAGDLTSSNNLSDVASPKTAFDNLSVKGADVASSSTIDLDAATGSLIDVTGTTTITAITLGSGRQRMVRFTGALTLTHGVSLVLCNNGSNITTAAGDYALFRGYAAGVVRCAFYQRASGQALSGSGGGGGLVAQGRLTLTTGVPVLTSNTTAAATVYYTPCDGNSISLHNGSSWDTITFAETSLVLSGGTASRMHDVFGYNNSGTLALELLAWTSDTARATAVTLQDGRYVKSGATTRLLLGSIYLDGSKQAAMQFSLSGANQTGQFGLCNVYNRREHIARIRETTTAWTYNSATWRRLNGSGNSFNYVDSVGDVGVSGSAMLPWFATGTGTCGAHLGLHRDWTSGAPIVSGVGYESGSSTVAATISTVLAEVGSVGRHSIDVVERAYNTTTANFYGSGWNGSEQVQMTTIRVMI